MLAKIPADWEQADKTFSELRKEERTARLKYRRSADNSYEPIRGMLKTLEGSDALNAFEKELNVLRSQVESSEPASMVEPVKDLANRIGRVDGTRDIKTPLSRARRALKARKPDKEKALAQIDKAVAAFQAQMQWREQAKAELVPGLQTYEAAIRTTLGLRLQDKMSREQALFVASCNAGHRDLSLNF